MAVESGTRVRLAYVAEVTRGTTPGSPSMKLLRSVGRNINSKKSLLTSEEVASHRGVVDSRHGFKSVEGTIPFELSLDAYNDFFESLMGGTWGSGPSHSAVDMGVTSNVISRASGSWVTDGFRPGDIITTTGFTGSVNNSVWVVKAVSALGLTVFGTMVNEVEASGKTVAYTGEQLKLGTDVKTFTVERQFLTLAKYQLFTGVNVSSGRFSIQPERLVGGEFGVMGISSAKPTGAPLDASPDAAATNSPFNSFVGELYINDTAQAVCTGIEFNVASNRTTEGVIGQNTTPDIFDGQNKITGTVTLMLENTDFVDDFEDEIEGMLALKLERGSDFMGIVMPRFKINGNDIDPAQSGPVKQVIPFEALYSSADASDIVFQKSSA